MLRVVSLVLLFIIRLRFPAHTSVFATIRGRYGLAVTREFRRWESVSKKLEKATLDEEFLRRCNTYGITPKFLKLRLYRRNLYRTPVYADIQQRLLWNEIRFKKRLIEKLQQQLTNYSENVKRAVSYFDYCHLKNFVTIGVCNYRRDCIDVQRRKFVNWGGSYDPTNVDPNVCIFNFSNYVLGKREKFLLGLGLDFCLPSFRYPRKQILLYMEHLLFKWKSFPVYNGTFENVTNAVKNMMNEFPKYARNCFSFISEADINILKNISKNENIVISKPDKGNGTVILNKVDYIEKMHNILGDRTKFRKSEEDIYLSTLNMENRINYQLRNLRDNGCISEEEYKQLFVSGSSPSILYGLPKVHKTGIPLRPILAAFKAPSYRLSKYLINLLQPLTVNNFTLKNTYEFKDVVSGFEFPPGSVMASFDITSLFTNVPIAETINIAVNTLYSNEDEAVNIPKKRFKKLLEVCVSDNNFLFNKEHYCQHEGFAMGSPLSAPMANIFLCYHEKRWLDECPIEFKPLLYRRYVDDTFLVFRKHEDIAKFHEYLNNRHENIKFTIEHERNNTLSFLDIQLNISENNNNRVNLGIFRKATFTGLGMNFHSHTYINFKLNNIRTLFHRAYNLCSTWQSFNEEVQFLIKFFKDNAYPEDIVFRVINKFLCMKTETPHPQKLEAMKCVFYHKLPFINNNMTFHIKKELNQIVSRYFPQMDFRLVFFNNFTLRGILNHKERLPDALCSDICYRYLCDACGATYVGSSKRCLLTRAFEHFGKSYRSGNWLLKPAPSSIREHQIGCKFSTSMDNFKVLNSYSDGILLRIAESLEIKFRNPTLNVDASAQPLILV